MKPILLIPLLIFSLLVNAQTLAKLSDIASLEWKNRVVVINAPKNTNKTLSLLKEQVAAIVDRDIIWFIIKEDVALSNYSGELAQVLLSNTRERLKPEKGEVILIGKDGGIKSRANRFDLQAIFSEIDAMPMRQYEMQN